MKMSGDDNKQSPETSANAWRDEIIQDEKGIHIEKRLLYRDPRTNKLIGCKVDAVLSDMKRFAVTITRDQAGDSDENDNDDWQSRLMEEQFVLPYRSFVKYDAELVETDCVPHRQAESIPKLVNDDPHHLDYPLCLVLVAGNARLEAARRLRDLDKKDSGRKCVFEIISGKVHYELPQKLFAYNASLASQKRRDLQMNYEGTRVVFGQDHAWDDTVINALSKNVRWRSQSVEMIAAIPKQAASIIKFKNGDSLLVRNDDLDEDNGSLASDNLTNEELEQRLKSLQRQINEMNQPKTKPKVPPKLCNTMDRKSAKQKSSMTPFTPKLGIQNKIINKRNPMMTRLADFGSGTISKVYAAQQSKDTEVPFIQAEIYL